MSAISGLAEIVLWVHDLNRSLSFYRDGLGLKLISPPGMQGRAFLQAGEKGEGFPQQIVLVEMAAGAPPFSTDKTDLNLHHLGLVLSPEAFESERERLQALGMEVRYGEHPLLPIRSLYIDDPDGNEVELASMTG
jgi:catechol 2,3-dioxygenase